MDHQHYECPNHTTCPPHCPHSSTPSYHNAAATGQSYFEQNCDINFAMVRDYGEAGGHVTLESPGTSVWTSGLDIDDGHGRYFEPRTPAMSFSGAWNPSHTSAELSKAAVLHPSAREGGTVAESDQEAMGLSRNSVGTSSILRTLLSPDARGDRSIQPSQGAGWRGPRGPRARQRMRERDEMAERGMAAGRMELRAGGCMEGGTVEIAGRTEDGISGDVLGHYGAVALPSDLYQMMASLNTRPSEIDLPTWQLEHPDLLDLDSIRTDDLVGGRSEVGYEEFTSSSDVSVSEGEINPTQSPYSLDAPSPCPTDASSPRSPVPSDAMPGSSYPMGAAPCSPATPGAMRDRHRRRRPRISFDTLTEAQKYSHIRNINNEASRTYRDRSRQNLSQLTVEERSLVERNQELRARLNKLGKLKGHLQSYLERNDDSTT